MKYAKLINGHPSYAPNPILVYGNWMGNPPGAVYEAEGFKAVVYAEDPGETPEGYRWDERWMDGENTIQQYFVLVEVPISEEEALIRYANELTGANDETLEAATERLIKQSMEVD